MKYIKLLLSALALLSIVSISGASANGLSSISSIKYDVTSSFVGEACSGLTNISTSGCSTGANTFKSIAKTVVEILSLVIGIVSVIMIIVSGIRFVFSGGDANSTASARSTLIYALVGLAIAVLAQVLAREVLTTASKIQNSSYLSNSSSIRFDS